MQTNTTVRVFGGMGVSSSDGPISIGGPRQRRLLALLAIRPDSVATIDWLAEYLWEDADRPEAVAPAIRTYVSRLRQALPEAEREWIATEAAGYRFGAPAGAVEHRRFALLRAQARSARDSDDPQRALGLLDEALALWRGNPFRELEDLDWAQADIEQLRLDRLEMFEERWEAALALGRHTQITGELAVFTAEHGLRDRAARQYALALHRSGRTAEGLRVIAEHRRFLVDQAGLEPSPEIVELEHGLLSGDPTLLVEKVGRPLRGYRLIEEIGSGAFSVVWRGVQPSVDREVAIKQIRSELASQPDFIRRFEAEAHLVARIEHPHIVPLIDFWRDPDSAYLVMRWLRGGTLEQRLDDGPLSVPETARLARQICGALSAAHAHGVIHRDVKAGNIFFDESGNAFLGDFGIALEATESAGPEAALSPGSPAYSSPEQIRRERLGPESDVFSLGVVIFECLTGSLPFNDSSSVEELIERQLHAPYPSLAELRADVPRSISDAVERATAKDPADRFASVEEFIAALESDMAPPTVSSAAGTSLDGSVHTDITNPYKGLRAFDDADSDQFFGRESLVSDLVDRLDGQTVRSRCVILVGPSGSGKSSVVRAGLIPVLRGGAVAGSSGWYTTTMVPGDDPYESLEAALLRIAVNPPHSLLAQLREGRRGIIRSIRRCLGSDDEKVLLVIDQFEEVFTGRASEDAGDFLDALAAAVEDPTSQLRLVITLRADYYDRPLSHPAFAQILKQAAVDVIPLAPNELEQAIVEPARQVGVEFEPGLVARMAAATIGQPSSLPMLQYTLSELFDHRAGTLLTLAAYDEIGGLSGALAARAEALYGEANDAQRVAIRRVFGRMANPEDGSADMRRRVPLADLGDEAAVAWVIDRFGAARLVTFDRDVASREPTVEVAHEALLREWPRLVAWLREDVEVLRRADVVASAAAAWELGGREDSDLYRGGRLENAIDLAYAAPDRIRAVDTEFIEASRTAAEIESETERRRVRRLRRLVVGVGVALVIALIAGGVAFRQRSDARAATRQAELATLISRSAAESGENPEISLLLALEAHRRVPSAETEQAVLNALGSSTIANRVSSLPPLFDPASCSITTISSDGTTEWTVLGGQLVSRDTLIGVVTDHGPPPAASACVRWMGNEDTNVRASHSENGLSMWFGPYDGQWDVERTFDKPTFWVKSTLFPTHRMIVLSDPGGSPVMQLLDDRTGEEIGAPIGGFDEIIGIEMTPDGSLIALGFAIHDGPEGDGLTMLIDGMTGKEIFRVTSRFPAFSLAFDNAARELVAGLDNGTIMTIDAATGKVVSEVETAARTSYLDVGVRPDGLVVAVSSAEIEIVDRRTGPTGSTVPLRGAGSARVRADGTVLIIDSQAGLEILDLNGNALVETAWPVDPFAQVSFGGGRAGATPRAGGTPQVIDLASGERSNLELIMPEGDRFAPAIVFPVAEDFWALNSDATLTRWNGNKLKDKVETDGDTPTGNRFGNMVAFLTTRADGSQLAHLANLAEASVVFTVPVQDANTVHPSLDGGLHVLNADATVHTYDSTGSRIGEIAIETESVGDIFRVDSASARIAVAAIEGVLIVDPATGNIESRIDLSLVANLAFAQNGELLAISRSDGTVRIWDVARGASAGLVWAGRGGAAGESWYDESTESIWVGSSGLLLQIPLNPERWIERACEIVGRDLTQDEWDRFVPGNEPLRSACSPSDSETLASTAPPTAGRITIEGEVEFTNTGASKTLSHSLPTAIRRTSTPPMKCGGLSTKPSSIASGSANTESPESTCSCHSRTYSHTTSSNGSNTKPMA